MVFLFVYWCIPYGQCASIACADFRRKPDACTGAISEAKTKTNDQAEGHGREFGKLDKE
jgi:hypothetical protein